MAKLNVKVVNEKVEYNGFVYGLINEGARQGDLIQCLEDDAVDLTYGAFYQVIGTDVDNDMQFLDDDNDERDRSVTDEEYKVFRKSHAITNDSLTDAEGVVTITLPDGTKLEGTPSDLEKITRSMQALQAEQVATVEMPEEVVEKEQLTPSQLQAGDYGKVVEKYNMFLPGDIVKVLCNDGSRVPYYAKRLSGGEEKWLLEKQLVHATEAEVKAATEPKVEPLKVGDYAKVVADDGDEYEKGDIVKIIEVDDSSIPYRGERLYDVRQQWLYKTDVVKATDEEVLEAKRALLKEGDFARVIGNTNNHRFEIGTVVKLGTEGKNDRENYFTTYYLDESDYWLVRRHDLEPLTKEEAEHTAREAEEEQKAKAAREKWAAIGREVGELRKGDIVSYLRKDLLLGKVLCVNSNYSRPGDVRYYIDFGEEACHVCTEKIDDLKLIATTESLFEQAPITGAAEKVE